MKKCNECQEWKPRDCFYKVVTNGDGLQSRCKECERVRKMERDQPKKIAKGYPSCVKCGFNFAPDKMVETKEGLLCVRCDNIEFLEVAKKYNKEHPIQPTPYIRQSVSVWDSLMGRV